MNHMIRVLLYANAKHDCTEAFTVNNLADTVSADFYNGNRAPNSSTGYVANNKYMDKDQDGIVGDNEDDMSSVLRDPANWDFRPKASASSVVARAQRQASFG